MPFVRVTILVAFLSGMLVLPATSQDWITAPSYYTHDATGQRVQQHTPIKPVYTYPRADFQRSGYRHMRSSLQFGGNVDHYHQVEEWGRPVRPYDEWRFPYRPYSAPYPWWGPPYAGLNFGFNFFPYGYPGGGYPGGGYPGGGYPGTGYPGTGYPGPSTPPPGNQPPGGNPPPGHQPPGNYPPGHMPHPPFIPPIANPFQPFVPFQGFQPWFDDRYPIFDDRAPFRREPFPTFPQP